MSEKKPVTQIFKFNSDELRGQINYKMNLFNRVREPLTFIYNALHKAGHSLTLKSLDNININKVKSNEGKNYNWSVVKYENIQLLIRQYGQHLTIYCRVTKFCDIFKTDIYTDSAFTFNSSLNLKDEEHDRKLEEYWENPFLDFNKCLKGIIEHIQKDLFHLLWNSASLPIPENVELKQAYETTKFSECRIHSYDLLVFCMEEIDTIHVQYFAETIMFAKLSELKVGQDFGSRDKIHEVRTKLEDGYYHGVGVKTIDKNDKKEWHDVYSLTRYYYDDVFPKEEVEEKEKK